MASIITDHLPPFEGWLPLWMLFTSVLSVGNYIQTYQTTHFTARVYNPIHPSPPSPSSSQVTPLSSRTFGTWTLLAAIIRLYGAYYINSQPVYGITMWAYGVAWIHFLGEWWVFGTTRWGAPLAGPVCISTGTLVWMWMARDFYLSQ